MNDVSKFYWSVNYISKCLILKLVVKSNMSC